ncbi:hypothetical protein ACTWP5_29455 [Streptomyces sp. 4N509B]|uniref:hypothetical protein n=1 Tax=Streptomyces sp. 4N509B TaxID=3457413 RepID=UPI003FCFF66C
MLREKCALKEEEFRVVNYEIVLLQLRAAVDRLDAVEARRSTWGARLADVLETFDQLDRWLSRGGALPADWAECRHPAVRAQRHAEHPDAPDGTDGPVIPRLPGPRHHEP